MDSNEAPIQEPGVAPMAKRVAQLERMVTVGHLLNSTLDLSELLELIIKTAAELVDAQTASIMLVDERTGELFFAAATGETQEKLRQVKVTVPIEGSIAGAIYRTGEPAIVDDVRDDSRHYSGVDRSISFHTQSILGVPLQVRNRRIGVLEALNKLEGAHFDQDDVRVLSTMASHAAVAIENARLVARLRDANRRLSDLDRMKSNFISIASHELRTPLTIVQGYASFLRAQASSNMSTELDMVLKGAGKLQAVIDQMTNLSYLNAAGDLTKEEFVLQQVLQEVCQEWQSLAETHSLTLRVKFPPAPIYVNGDVKRITLAMNNLLNNAVKFTPEGGHIEVAIAMHTGRVSVSVSDTGIGIPKEELTRIFDGFYQVEDHLVRHHEGLGLGLAIAKEVVTLHGGRIWAESIEGRGSRLIFTLPVVMKLGRE
ncbi:MAG: GAF domain-containing sensor histidine kinase [Anaerolineae bacterium]|nr:GAF domain-containing sensor histidine kinase [Anaerolineae bacterium]